MLSFESHKIETARLIIRPLKDSDWEAIHIYSGDPEVCRYLEWGPNTSGETREFVRRANRLALQRPRLHFDFGLTIKGSPLVVGNAGLVLQDETKHQAYLGYLLSRAHWRKGYMTEAALAVINFGFEQLQIHRISASCDAQNEASAHVLEHCGMRREGHFLQDKYVKGRWRDTFFYSLLREDWLKGKQA